MFAVFTGNGSKGGGEELEYVWDDGVKMKSVFAEPHRVDANLDRVWKYIFSDMSEFLNHYHEYRGDSDLQVSEWKNVETVGGVCSCVRKVEAHIAVPYSSRLVPGVPTSTHLVEFHRAERTADKIDLRICAATPDIPYGHDFRIQAHIVFEALPGGKSCKAQITVGIFFLREPFLITKTLRKKAVQHAKEGYTDWLRLAKQCCIRGRSFVLDQFKSSSDNDEPLVETAYNSQANAGITASQMYTRQ